MRYRSTLSHLRRSAQARLSSRPQRCALSRSRTFTGFQDSSFQDNPREGVLAETRGKRARVYDRPEFRDEVKAEFPDSICWPNHGLPPARHVLLAGKLQAYTDNGDEIVAHGGIAMEEVMVPFVTITRDGA